MLVVLFVGFFLLTQPAALADLSQDAVSEGWSMLVSLFEAIIDFVNALGS